VITTFKLNSLPPTDVGVWLPQQHQGGNRFVGQVEGHEDVVVNVAGEHIARNTTGAQRGRKGSGKSNRFERAMDHQCQPGRLELDGVTVFSSNPSVETTNVVPSSSRIMAAA
jgi:hypothetical protein